MKKSVSRDIVELERMPTTGDCKYKMRVSLADELTKARSKPDTTKHNDNPTSSIDAKLLSTNAEFHSRKSLCDAKKQLSRASSKDDLKVRRMQRSSSELFGLEHFNQMGAKTDEFAYRSLLRHYQKALLDTTAPKLLKEEQIGKLFCMLGFLPTLITKEDQAIISTVRYMLTPTGRRGVNHQNLFMFMLVVCGINPNCHPRNSTAFDQCNAASGLPHEPEQTSEKPLVVIEVGNLDTDDKWHTNESERKQLRKIFGKLYYNKISSEEVKYKKVQEQEQPLFRPQILSYSRNIAHAKRNKILREVQQYCEIRPSNQESIDLAELLMLDKKVKEEKINIRIKEKENIEQSSCTFHPKINRPIDTAKTESSQVDSNSKDRCLKLYDKSKQTKLEKKNTKRPTIEEIEIAQLKECTFKPASTKYNGGKSIKLSIRNESKLVERMKEGRQMRLIDQTFKNRGYPENTNWTSFVRDCKRKGSSSNSISCKRSNGSTIVRSSACDGKQHSYPQRVPLLSMDIKLHNDTFQLEVFNGDSLESLTSKILVRHELPYERFDRIANLIGNVIDGCKGMCVINGVVHEVAV